MHERHSGTGTLHRIAGYRERPQRHPVECVGKADDRLAPGDVPRQLECGLDGIGPGGAGELHLVVHAAGQQDGPFEFLEELLLSDGGHVQAMHHAIGGQVVDESGLQYRIVVPVVECAGTGEEI